MVLVLLIISFCVKLNFWGIYLGNKFFNVKFSIFDDDVRPDFMY